MQPDDWVPADEIEHEATDGRRRGPVGEAPPLPGGRGRDLA
jgi:hypothetical protein